MPNRRTDRRAARWFVLRLMAGWLLLCPTACAQTRPSAPAEDVPEHVVGNWREFVFWLSGRDQHIRVRLAADLKAAFPLGCFGAANVEVAGDGHRIDLSALQTYKPGAQVSALHFRNVHSVLLQDLFVVGGGANVSSMIKVRGDRDERSQLVVRNCRFADAPLTTGINCSLLGNAQILGCVFDGVASERRATAQAHPIYHTGRHLLVRQCTFRKTADLALVVRDYHRKRPDDYLPVGRVVIEDCRFDDCQAGITITAGGAEQLRICNNVFRRIQTYCIGVEQAQQRRSTVIDRNDYPAELDRALPFKVGNRRVAPAQWQGLGYDRHSGLAPAPANP